MTPAPRPTLAIALHKAAMAHDANRQLRVIVKRLAARVAKLEKEPKTVIIHRSDSSYNL